MKIVLILALMATLCAVHGFSRNAIELGLVSDKYPIEFWDELAMMTEADLAPDFLRLILKLDRKRSGDQHWCCHHGRDEQAKVPVYNDRGEIVAYNTVPCEKLGCCKSYLEVANHCLDKEGQTHLVNALDIAKSRLGDQDTKDLINLIKAGGLVG